MQNILVTGSSGFVGFHLVRQLSQTVSYQGKIRCLVRSTSQTDFLNPFNVQFCTAALDNPENLRNALDGCDTVFHLAGRVRAKNYAEFEQVNRFGTANIVNAAVQSGVQTFIHVSSLAAAGASLRNKPKMETDAPLPISAYGKSKLAGEAELYPLADKMNITVIRPGIVFGEADKMNLELFKAVKRWGISPNPGWTKKYFSWIHATDLAVLLIAAAKNGERLKSSSFAENAEYGQGIYYVSESVSRQLSEVALAVRCALGKKRIIPVACPPAAVWTISTFYEIVKRCTGKDTAFDWAKAAESMHHWTCSAEKAVQQLGFAPQPLEERIRQTICWYQEHHWL